MANEVDAAGSGVVGGLLMSTNVGAAKRSAAAAAQSKSKWAIDSSGVKELRKEFQGLHKDLQDVIADLKAISSAGGIGGGMGGGGNSNGAGRATSNGSSMGRAAGAAIGLGAGLAFHRINRTAGTNVVADQVLNQYASAYGGGRNGAASTMNGLSFGDRMSQLGTMSIATQYGMGGNSFGQYSKSINQIIGLTGNTNPMTAAQTYMGFSSPQTTMAGVRFGMQASGALNMNGSNNDFGSIVKSWGSSGLIGAGRGVAPTVSQMALALRPGSVARANLSSQGITGSSQDALLQALQDNANVNGGSSNFMDFNTKTMKARLSKETGRAEGMNSSKDQNFMDNNYDALVNGAKAQQESAKLLGSIDQSLKPLYGLLGPLAPLAGSIATLGKSVLEVAFLARGAGGLGSMGAIGEAVGGLGVTGGLAVAGTALGAGVVGFGASKVAQHFGASKAVGVGVGALGGAALGAEIGSFGGPLGIGAGALVGGIVGGIGGMLGDPVSDGAQRQSDAAGFKPEFRAALDKMMAANPRITITAGSYRSTAEQTKLFLDRHTQDPNGKIKWNGQRWTLKKGMAPAAPPGSSLHQFGLAADLGPPSQMGWVAANAAKYGLDIQTGLSIGENWHIQMAGAQSQLNSGSLGSSSDASQGSSSATSSAGGTSGGFTPTAQAMGNFTNSIADNITAGLSTFASPTYGSGGGSSGGGSGGSSAGAGGTVSGTGIQGVISAAKAAGFTGQGLVDIVAIAMRESSGDPNAFHNSAARHDGTKDLSYGLTQINMLGSMGPARLKQFGISDASQLLDPLTNMQAAFKLSGGGKDFNPWGGYKGMDPLHGTDVGAAQKAIGDAFQGSSSPVGGVVIHATFHVHANGSTPSEAMRLSNQIATNLEHAAPLREMANR